MSVFVVWVDRENAKIYEFSDEKMEKKVMKSTHIEHHTHRSDAIDDQKNEKQFHSQVGAALKAASRLLILGPGVAKHHFQNYLTEHLPALAKNIVGCETVDHPSDGEIAVLAQKVLDESFRK